MDKLQNFVVWLDGYLEATGDEINISKTNLIKNKLYNLFEHEAEKQTLGESKDINEFQVKIELPNIKKGFGKDPKGVLYRC